MEGYILLAVFIIFAPIIISIVALVKVANLKAELKQVLVQISGLRNELRHQAGERLPKAQACPQPETVAPAPKPAPAVSPVPSTPVPVAVVPRPKPAKEGRGLEFMMGGKAAAFIGIAILVAGIALLVGYAIQQDWMGPGTRVVLGLLAGGGLVGIGHFTGLKDRKYMLFARVLTGGGSALFYFTVFAAYAFYHLIGPWAAGAGLFASALAVFGLAMVYGSQAVGVLGVLGAFTTPLLIDGDMDAGVFPLVYVALVNVPVILLGVRRKWQVLYNLAFVFTVIHYLSWIEWVGAAELWPGLGFALLFFGQYAALGLLKLRCEQRVQGRAADMIRLVSASLLLLAIVYGLLDDAGKNQWIGAAFLLLALLHVGLAQFAFKTLTRFNGEILAFLAGGLAFAILALPAQLDGEWVSLGWALEGVVLAWFALRVQSRTLQAGAFLLGLIGLSKGLLYDVTLYVEAPRLFLNARFIVGMLSAVLLSVQGVLAGRFPEEQKAAHWQDAMWWIGVVGAVVVFFADTFWTLGPEDASSWLITSIMLLVTGAVVVLLAPAKSSVTKLGSLLLLAVPVKLLVIDAWFGLDCGGYRMTPFGNAVIWLDLFMVVLVIVLLIPRISARAPALVCSVPAFSRLLQLSSLAAGIGVVSIEILRKPSDWANMAVTILWAVCALALILFGMKRRSAAHRYFGLILFGLATLKVLVVDSSELDGLERIFAFIGTGVLLLVLSFAYQKAAAFFESQGEES
jgi:uncharacterized membrane protein